MCFCPSRRLVAAIQAAVLGASLGVITPSALAGSPFLRASATPSPESPDQDAQLALAPRTVTVSPGSTVILELAIDHLNRIVTPFRQPSVRTVASVSTEVDGGVIYVATADETPATLFITEADAAQTTIALTLAPRRVPPREIRLRVPGVAQRPASAQDRAEAPESAPSIGTDTLATWRQPQRYIEELTQGFRALALGEVPDGAQIARSARGEGIDCGPGWQVRNLQRFEGAPLRWMSATLRSNSASSMAFDKGQCRLRSGAGIAAVARWPSDPPASAQETRLIIAIDPHRAPLETASQARGAP